MRRAITWVYCEPKSKMTICSVMVPEKRILMALGGVFDQRKFFPNEMRVMRET